MATGKSLHIGLNFLDPNHYSGWDGQLNACENDAKDMEAIASSQGFQAKTLLRKNATRKNVIDAINEASSGLKEGDIFYISYSGHGGQLPDINGDDDDGQDETWCLFDGQLIDDELFALWSNFEKGVRIFVTSDSCHSGSIIKAAKQRVVSYSNETPRYMNDQYSLAAYHNNKVFYDGLMAKITNVKTSEIKASVLLISGCQDNQYSYDGAFNGTFTAALKRVWNGGRFSGNYKLFHKQILNLLPAYQSPNYLVVGAENQKFEQEVPYTI